MGRSIRMRFSGLCLSRIATHVRVAVRPPPGGEPKPMLESAGILEKAAVSSEKKEPWSSEADPKEKANSGGEKAVGRRIMIVAEPAIGVETRSAVQWALTHVLHPNDTVLLLCVCKPVAGRNSGAQLMTKIHAKEHDLLQAMKNLCRTRKPEVEVETSIVEGKEKGPTIVWEARRQEASLLILGQRKRSLTWRLLVTWARPKVGSSGNGTGRVVDYCIQNAHCMTLAVRKKGRNVGGYLLTTKKHKDFWLLA